MTRDTCAVLGHHWGAGCGHVFSKNTQNSSLDYEELLEQVYVTFGGIYLASSVADSCRAWNCGVAAGPGAVAEHGDVEHLRWALPGAGVTLRPGQIYWITDRWRQCLELQTIHRF